MVSIAPPPLEASGLPEEDDGLEPVHADWLQGLTEAFGTLEWLATRMVRDLPTCDPTRSHWMSLSLAARLAGEALPQVLVGVRL